ncbi:MAG: toxin-antitoxin system YwqK family antitoxin [Microbacteriaceae bacterium]
MSVPEDSPNAYDAEGRKTGQWTEPDPHSGVMTGGYVAGRRQGLWRHVAGDGRLRSEGEYDDGALHGAWTWYRANGALMQRGSFEHDVKHGRWERWDASGRLIYTGDYDNGRKSG